MVVEKVSAVHKTIGSLLSLKETEKRYFDNYREHVRKLEAAAKASKNFKSELLGLLAQSEGLAKKHGLTERKVLERIANCVASAGEKSPLIAVEKALETHYDPLVRGAYAQALSKEPRYSKETIRGPRDLTRKDVNAIFRLLEDPSAHVTANAAHSLFYAPYGPPRVWKHLAEKINELVDNKNLRNNPGVLFSLKSVVFDPEMRELCFPALRKLVLDAEPEVRMEMVGAFDLRAESQYRSDLLGLCKEIARRESNLGVLSSLFYKIADVHSRNRNISDDDANQILLEIKKNLEHPKWPDGYLHKDSLREVTTYLKEHGGLEFEKIADSSPIFKSTTASKEFLRHHGATISEITRRTRAIPLASVLSDDETSTKGDWQPVEIKHPEKDQLLAALKKGNKVTIFGRLHEKHVTLEHVIGGKFERMTFYHPLAADEKSHYAELDQVLKQLNEKAKQTHSRYHGFVFEGAPLPEA